MNPQGFGLLWTAALLIVVGGGLAALVIVLRTPVKLLNLRTDVEELKAQVALMDGTVKKAARRAGVAERKARQSEPDPPLFDLDSLPDATDGAPPRGRPPAPPPGDGDLDAIRNRFRRRP